MITDDGHVKVMDFGLAKPLADGGQADEGDTTAGSLTGSGVRVARRRTCRQSN